MSKAFLSLNFEKKRNIPKLYKINNEKFINPEYLHRNVPAPVIDNWPAHSSGRLHPHTQVMVTNNHHMKVMDEHESKLPNLVPKPKFLEFLENHVKVELVRNEATKVKPMRIRLQIYGDVFEWIIQALKSYRPLLAAIKREYEMNMDFLRSELSRVEPMKELLWTLSQEYDQRLIEYRSMELNEITSLKKEIKKMHVDVSDLEFEKYSLQSQVDRLVEELETQNNICRTEADARKIVITDMNEMRSKLKEMERMAAIPSYGEEKEDPVKIRWAYEQAKLALVDTNRKLVEIQTSYCDVVPKKLYDTLLNEHSAHLLETGEMKIELTAMSESLIALQNQYNAIYIQRDHLYMQLKSCRHKMSAAKMDKSDQKVHQSDISMSEEVEKWARLAKELPHDELVKRINEELSKTDGSAEVALEVFMNPELKGMLALSALPPRRDSVSL